MSLEVLLYISEVSDSIRIFLLAIGWTTFIITLCIMFSKSCELETGILDNDLREFFKRAKRVIIYAFLIIFIGQFIPSQKNSVSYYCYQCRKEY